MQNVLAPLINLYQTQLDISRKCADALFSGTEKIDRVMIGATHRMFSEQMNFVQALASVRDPRAVGDALQMGFKRHVPDDPMNYQKEIMRIFADMQNEIGRSLQGYVQEFSANAANAPNAAASPLQSVMNQANDTAFNPMTSMFSVWESAFKDVAALARKNMAGARANDEEPVVTTKQAAANYADVASRTVHTATDNPAATAAAAGKSPVTIVDESTATDKGRGVASTSGDNKKR